MAKQLITRIWCDNSAAHAEEEAPEGESHVLKVDGMEAELDLCESCAKTLLDPLHELLRQAGQPLAPSPMKKPQEAAQEPSVKPWLCECGKRYKSRSSLHSHRRTAHDGVHLQRSADGLFHCEACERAFTTPQGYGRHKASIHPELMEGPQGVLV